MMNLPRTWRDRFSRALILENPDPSLDAELRALGIEPHRVAAAPDEDTLVRILEEGQHHLIFKRSRVEINARVVAASKSLAGVMLCCIGDDSVDKRACADAGVLVTNDPVSNGRSVAELVIGSLIMLSRRIFDAVGEMNTSVWRKNNRARFEVMNKRLGIVGLGNIGRQVAQLAQAMGMEICFYDCAEVPREVGRAMGFTLCESIEDVFRASDFVSLHVSATDHQGRSNNGLITYEMMHAFSEGNDNKPRVLLNLARGFIIQPDQLLRAVQDGFVQYVITDVFPEEPGPATTEAWHNPYEEEPRIFTTPHIGAATVEAQPRIAKYVARTTQLFSDYGMIRNCVLRDRANIIFDAPPSGAMLSVVHVDTRGTKKAVDDAIYKSGANNLRSAHVDFPEYGIAYDLSALDGPLDSTQCEALVNEACRITKDSTAIRWMRMIDLSNA